MKENKYFLNTALAVILALALAVCALIRALQPTAVLPGLDIPGMVLLSLLALLADHYLAPGAGRCWVCIPVLGGITFGLLPWAAAFAAPGHALKLAAVGAAVFTATAWLFTSAQDRLSSGPAAKAAPAVTALGLYLASQCFMGMIL